MYGNNFFTILVYELHIGHDKEQEYICFST
jgi:hypothetical protein